MKAPLVQMYMYLNILSSETAVRGAGKYVAGDADGVKQEAGQADGLTPQHRASAHDETDRSPILLPPHPPPIPTFIYHSQ